MDRFSLVKTSENYTAVILKKEEIGDFMLNNQSILLNRERIPNIIHISKEYDTFEWKVLENEKIEEILKNKSIYGIALLSKETTTDFQLCKIEITVKPNYYSHNELIKLLTPIKLEFSAYEIIGDIIHLNLTEQQQEYKQIIADIIYFKTGKTVINKTGKIEETFRFYNSEILAGPKTLSTVHKENDVKFYLDLGKVYWCSRLQTERIRILKMIKKNEVICDPFCGAGPHVVPAIKKGAIALCNDLNPSAIDCLKRSLELNKIQCECVENIDAGEFLIKHEKSVVNHFIFNLPEHSLEYIKFTEKYSGNFYLHVFFFCKESVEVAEYVNLVTGYKVKKEWLREVRKVSPSKSVYKLEVISNEFFSFQKS